MPLSVQNPAVKWVFELAVMSRSGVVVGNRLREWLKLVSLVLPVALNNNNDSVTSRKKIINLSLGLMGLEWEKIKA